MSEKTIIQAINEALRQALAADERAMILGQDIGVNGGVFRATDGLQKQFGPDRVFDTPISESGIMGASVGLALNGFKPIVEVEFLGFIHTIMEQLCTQAARMRMRTKGQFTVPLVVRGPFGGGVHALELHSDSYEAFFAHSPGMKVVIPSNPYDAKGLLLSAIDDPDPVIFFEPMKIYRTFKMEVPDEAYRVPIGKAAVAREGDDVTVISWGAPVRMALDTAEQMQQEHNISVEVVDLRSLVPFDNETVMNSVRKTGRAVVVHEAVKTGGFGGEVATRIMEEAFLYLQAPVMRVTGYDTPYPFTQVENEWLPTETRLMKAINDAITY